MLNGISNMARSIFLLALCLLGIFTISGSIIAQQPNSGLGGSGSLPGLEGFVGLPVSFSAKFEVEESSDRGRLSVTAELDDDYHIYSVTQPKGGPRKTVFKIVGKEVEVTGEFVSDQPPENGTEDFGKAKVPVEKHHGKVSWTAPIKFATGIATAKLKFKVEAIGQVCSKNCIPVDETFEPKFAGSYPPTTLVTPNTSITSDPTDEGFRDPEGHVLWTASIQPSSVNAGSNAELKITARPDETFHVYPVKVDDKQTNYRTQLIVTVKSGLRFGSPVASSPAQPHEVLPDEPPVEYHEGSVTWTIPIVVPEGTKTGMVQVKGLIGYQACNEDICDQPMGIEFQSQLEVSEKPSTGSSKVELKATPFKTVASAPMRTSWVDGNLDDIVTSNAAGKPVEAASGALGIAGLMSTFALAMVAGFILNFMPCVLPVIGLKIAGFVQEGSGDNRRTTFLTLWYVAGIVAFLMGLALVIVIARDSFGFLFLWGEQFTDFHFRVGMTVVVFAMALSFLGVWDIPIPGFANTKKSGQLMSREGASGAFFKGVFSTILATPCSGPFLGPVIATSLTQPSWVTLTLFFGIALGMAFPYLLIAMYPRSIAWLPKPGPWMDTFKQFLAFPLLLTTVFFVSQFSDGQRIAAMTMLICVWFSCWIFGQVPGWAELGRKLTVWTTAILIGVVTGWASFHYLGPVNTFGEDRAARAAHEGLIAWEPFSQERLAQLTAEGKTVIIDFTAEWCLICKTNLTTAIETEKVAQLIKKNGVVPLLADWTEPSPEIKSKLIELKSASIPVLAIYSSKSPNPVVLRDSLIESTVLREIESAGPSRTVPLTAGAKKRSNETAGNAKSKFHG